MVEQLRGRTLAFNQAGEFAAFDAMQEEMRRGGFSIGASQRGAPLGVLHGDYIISKWRNLDEQDRAQLHGIVAGDHRTGPLLVTIFDHAPRAARDAISRMFGDRLRAAYANPDAPHAR